jgi:Flp pilus assembly protein TadD
MIAAVVAAAIAAQPVAGPNLSEISHAIASDRLEQARQMLATAMAEGKSGDEVDGLLADLAFANKNWAEAQTRYAALLQKNAGDGHSAEQAAIASLMLGDLPKAAAFVNRALASKKASWRGWNAKGVLCDFAQDWKGADEAFATAAKMKPDNSEIVNNQGWSLILRGKWEQALKLLEQAAILDPQSARVKNNLELAREALASNLPERRPGESDTDFAARLNDAGVVAARSGDRSRAIAAFSQALSVSGDWYARAANNLAQVESR